MHLKRLWLVKMKYENDIDKSFVIVMIVLFEK